MTAGVMKDQAATVVAMLIANSSNDAKVWLAGKETRQSKLTLVDVLQSWWVSLCPSLSSSPSLFLPPFFISWLFVYSLSLTPTHEEGDSDVSAADSK